MANARAAKAWFAPTAAATIARTSSRDDQRRGGGRVRHHTTFGFWDWVGGRYSLWSAIGLPIAIADRRDGLPRAAGRRARDGRALRARAGREEPAAAARADRRLVPQLPRLHEPLHGAVPPGA
jgi:glucose-6-phosphate isomerase